jgi:hypothetical protein
MEGLYKGGECLLNERPIGRVDLKKELLIAAWFWIGAQLPGDCEWSRRWAPTFEAEYRARKAALPAEAGGDASKKEKNASSAP